MTSRPEQVSATGSAAPRRSRRGRPTAERAAAIDDTVVAAALELFIECGYEAATMEAIAERARISKGTLYARYPGKEALFRTVLKDRLDRWSALSGARDHLLPADPARRLQARARTLQRMFEWPEYREITRLLETATASFPDVAAYWRERGTQNFIGILADDIKAAADETPGGAPDCTFLANLFLYTFSGWYRMERTSRELHEDEVSAFADQIIATILTVVAASKVAGALVDNQRN